VGPEFKKEKKDKAKHNSHAFNKYFLAIYQSPGILLRPGMHRGRKQSLPTSASILENIDINQDNTQTRCALDWNGAGEREQRKQRALQATL
jgi:hypothetical protein